MRLGTNLGPTTDKLGLKPCTETQNKAKRVYHIAFKSLPWAQEVWSSNLGAPTTYFFNFNSFFPSMLRGKHNLGPNTNLSTLFTARRCSSGIACK